jgi:hypothetical protein
MKGYILITLFFAHGELESVTPGHRFDTLAQCEQKAKVMAFHASERDVGGSYFKFICVVDEGKRK